MPSSMAFHHLTTRKTRASRSPLDEVGLTQSNNESCQWRMWQESAWASNSLSSYVQIDNYEALPPGQRIAILLAQKLARVQGLQNPDFRNNDSNKQWLS